MTNVNSILAIAGPQRELQKMRIPEKTYDKVVRFYTPDDHGEFPDMGAYESRHTDEDGNEYVSHDWETFKSDMEDCQLYPYMLKCVDAVADYMMKQAELLERLNFINIKTTMNGHKFGGKVFAIAGFVSYECWPVGKTPMGKGIVIAR